MAEHPDLPGIPQATVVPRSRARISVVWIIPVLAAVVALGIAVQRILSEGPTITITSLTERDNAQLATARRSDGDASSNG